MRHYTMGYGNERFRITGIEKTLLDCFDLPQYSGGMKNDTCFLSSKISIAVSCWIMENKWVICRY
jgi:predicted transcriptional regulator of viral defense system